jgi:uncharacterized membrane protein
MRDKLTQRIKKTVLVPYSNNRITELDFFRWIALILMVYFHLIWSMSQLYGYDIIYSTWVNFYIGKISAILFILISGIVVAFGKFNLKRFLLLAGVALAISGVSYLYNDQYFIKFGIIHFFALSSLLAVAFKYMNKYILLIIWIVIIRAWPWISTIGTSSDYLFFLWTVSKWFQSADFYPLIPRFGVYLLGMWISKIFYAKRTNLCWKTFNVWPINFVGRNTLLIYIIHQPIIIFILYVIQLVR